MYAIGAWISETLQNLETICISVPQKFFEGDFLHVPVIYAHDYSRLIYYCCRGLRSIVMSMSVCLSVHSRNSTSLGWRQRTARRVASRTVLSSCCAHSWYAECDRQATVVRQQYRFRVIASYLSKVAHFNRPHLHLAPPDGWPRSNFVEIFSVR